MSSRVDGKKKKKTQRTRFSIYNIFGKVKTSIGKTLRDRFVYMNRDVLVIIISSELFRMDKRFSKTNFDVPRFEETI